ncbi:hypothetical protein GVAV_001161 [Gurleya vavrai]
MDDPYKILQISKNATKEETKKAFHKLQLKYHPDRKTGDKEMYMKIVSAYKSISKNEEFIILYKNFKNSYLDSEEEFNDLKMLYKKYKGDMRKIIDNHLLSEDEDEERLRKLIEGFIENKILKRFKSFDKKLNSKRKRKENFDELAELLKKNEENRIETIKKIEEKYCNHLKK